MGLSIPSKQQRNLWRGALAGAVGGLVGSFVMGQFHSMIQNPVSTPEQGKEDSTEKAASDISRNVFHRELTTEQKKKAGPVVHYAFGASMGMIYGAAVESIPTARAGWGITFGSAVWLGAHVITVPALGWSEPVTKSTPVQEGSEFASHLVYGVVAENIRRSIRARLLR